MCELFVGVEDHPEVRRQCAHVDFVRLCPVHPNGHRPDEPLTERGREVPTDGTRVEALRQLAAESRSEIAARPIAVDPPYQAAEPDQIPRREALGESGQRLPAGTAIEGPDRAVDRLRRVETEGLEWMGAE